TPPKNVSAEPEPEAPIRGQPTRGKGGRKPTDPEKLERAREMRAKAAEERRRAQEAAGESAPAPPKGGSARNRGAPKQRKNGPGPREHSRARGTSLIPGFPGGPNERQRRHACSHRGGGERRAPAPRDRGGGVCAGGGDGSGP